MFQRLSQFDLARLTQEEIIRHYALIWGARLLKIVLIFILARLALRFGYRLIQRLFDPGTEKTSILPEKKSRTVAALLTSVWRYFVYTVTLVLVITELDIIEIGPILAGAGVLGVALGFGAQSLVRDVIAGFFIILEDQFSVGDYITSAGFSGIVEELGLRITKIRDFGGELHIIPNGKIEAVTNHTRGNMRALVDISVAYEQDVDEVLALLEKLCRDFAAGTPEVVEGPVVLGITSFEPSAVVIRLIARTVPMTQWKVERELRRAIKKAFTEHGIDIPYPRRVIYNRSESKEAGE